MSKLVKIIGGLVVLLVVVVGVAFVVVNAMSWNTFKPYIVDATRDATGRELTIEDLDGSLSLGLQVDVAMSGVRLANAPGMEPADMVSLGKVETTVQLLPYLLGNELKIDRLVVEKPVAALAVDKDGRPNWVFDGKGGGGDSSGGGEGGGDMKVGIGELRVSDGAFTYNDAVSGQTVAADQIQLAVAPTDLVTPLKVDGSLVLNKEPVKLTVNLDAPQKLIDGQPATAVLALQSKHVQANYDGTVQSEPVPGLDGTFTLDMPSAARLAAWLDQPLAKGQPDPGPLKVRAVFASEGTKVALSEAVVEGADLNLKANGSIDASGEVTKVVLNVDSGVLNVDRYLPPAETGGKPAAVEAAKAATPNPLELLSNEKIDVSALRKVDADIKVALAGLKVSGLSFGKIDFTALAKDGVLDATLAPLALYGGNVAGTVKVDAKASTPTLAATAKVDKVKVDEIAKAATGEATVVGVASADIAMTSKGDSPRALAQALVGKATVNLGEVKNTPGGALTEAVLTLDLPGIDKQATLNGHVVFNKEKVDIAATLDPMQKVLSSDRFNADLKLTAAPVTASYAGAVQVRPVPGGDGSFAANVPSVGRLLAWLGQPLDKAQPDPGPLDIKAELATAGEDFELKSATIKGKAIDATAKATVKAGDRPRFNATVDVQQANLNAYLPPEEKQPKGKPAATPAAGAEQGWSREPIDFSGLRNADGKAVVNLANVVYRNLTIDKGQLVATVENGVLDAEVKDLGLAGGRIVAEAKVDASGDAAVVTYKADVENVAARPLLTAFADSDRISGTANVTAEGSTRGASQYELVKALNGKGAVKFTDGAIHGINLASALRKAQALGLDSTAGEEQKTDFAELGGTYTITNGVVDNQDFAMLAPLIRLGGAGRVPMPPRTLNYGVEAKLVPTLKGQGGDDALAGVPIPIKLTGTWANPSYAVDWEAVLKTLAQDPAKLAKLPGALSDKAKDLGIALPGLGKAGDVLKGVTGGKDSGGGVGKLLQGVTGGATAPKADDAATPPATPTKKKPSIEDAAKGALKGLLNKD
ncbi:MAG: AsmA family protein [Alphaproteobacteria bacterium]